MESADGDFLMREGQVLGTDMISRDGSCLWQALIGAGVRAREVAPS